MSQDTSKFAYRPLSAVRNCLSCELCGRLYREATTISECLHTYCKKCIYEHFKDRENCFCPTCQLELGGNPFEKLRTDNQLSDIVHKLFPKKKKKLLSPDHDAAEEIRRQELEMLESTENNGATINWENGSGDQDLGNLDDTVSTDRGSEDDNQMSIEEKENSGARNRKQRAKKVHMTPNSISPTNGNENLAQMALLGPGNRTVSASRPQPFILVDKAESDAIWLILQTATDTSPELALPQLTKSYLKIKDGSMRVGTLRNYVAAKLNLAAETEVEISCRQKPLALDLSLQSVQRQWYETAAGSSYNHGDTDEAMKADEKGMKQLLDKLQLVLTYRQPNRPIKPLMAL